MRRAEPGTSPSRELVTWYNAVRQGLLQPRAGKLLDQLIGLAGLPDWGAMVFAVAVGIVLVLKGALFFVLMVAFKLRARSAFLTASFFSPDVSISLRGGAWLTDSSKGFAGGNTSGIPRRISSLNDARSAFI